MKAHLNSAAEQENIYTHHIVSSLQGRQEAYYKNIEVFLVFLQRIQKIGCHWSNASHSPASEYNP